MPDAKNHPLRLWPDMKLPSPPVLVGPWEARANGAIVPAWRTPGDLQARALPDELWLRDLLDLDMQNPEAIARFCSRFGPLRFFPAGPGVHQHSVPSDGDFREGTRDLHPERDGIADEKERVWMKAIATSIRVSEAYPDDLSIDYAFHVTEFRAVASELRDCARVVLALTGRPEPYRDGIESSWWAWPPWFGDDAERHARWAVLRINEGLRELWPRVIAPGWESDEPGVDWVSADTAICLQLFNALHSNPHYSTCDFCGRLFINQQGRSKFGGHRPRPKYCSVVCADAQRQRDYRAKKREAQTSGTSGGSEGS